MKLYLSRSRDERRIKPYALHTERGEMLPMQANVLVTQNPNDLTRITVEFIVDDESVFIEKSYGET